MKSNGNKDNSKRHDENVREKPFTELYPKWDAPTFDPSKTYIQPKSMNETSNRSVLSRIYESVLDGFSDARKKLLKEQVERPQVWGSNG